MSALEFVRPIRLQVEHTAIAEVLQTSIALAESKIPRRKIDLTNKVDEGLPPIQGETRGSMSGLPRLTESRFCDAAPQTQRITLPDPLGNDVNETGIVQ